MNASFNTSNASKVKEKELNTYIINQDYKTVSYYNINGPASKFMCHAHAHYILSKED